MYAAHNRIWLSPVLLPRCVGPSLRRAVTAHGVASVSCNGKRRCGTDAAFGLVGYLRRDTMVPMSCLHRQLACKANAAVSRKRA